MPQRSLKILKTRRRFTDEQKNVAVQKALELIHGEYRSLYATARELGVCQTTLKRWLDQHATKDRGRFIPVEMAVANHDRPVVRNSRGVQVDGLTIDGVARLFRLLAD